MIKNFNAGRSLKILVALSALLSATTAKATPVLVVDTASHEVLCQEEAGAPWYLSLIHI